SYKIFRPFFFSTAIDYGCELISVFQQNIVPLNVILVAYYSLAVAMWVFFGATIDQWWTTLSSTSQMNGSIT
ncbi:MAG TPA: hypothetical protein VN457_07965, partial [Chlamydiales bacterium]|nr:hypothetical protein [Chlamydiales bacterium]